MSAACPRFGFIISSAPAQRATALVQALAERLATAGLEVDASQAGAAIVITREGSQATEDDRQFVIAMLDDMDAGAAIVSDLVDLNY